MPETARVAVERLRQIALRRQIDETQRGQTTADHLAARRDHAAPPSSTVAPSPATGNSCPSGTHFRQAGPRRHACSPLAQNAATGRPQQVQGSQWTRSPPQACPPATRQGRAAGTPLNQPAVRPARCRQTAGTSHPARDLRGRRQSLTGEGGVHGADLAMRRHLAATDDPGCPKGPPSPPLLQGRERRRGESAGNPCDPWRQNAQRGERGPPGHSPKLGNGASRVAVSFDTESAKINDGASDYEVDEVWCSAPNQCGQPALRRFQPPAQALAAAGCLTGRSIVRPGGGRCFDSGRVTAYPFRPRDGVSA